MPSSRVAILVLLTAVLGFTAGRVTAPKRRAPPPTVPAASSLPPEVMARAAAAAANEEGDVDDGDGDAAAQSAPAWLVREYEAEVKRLQGEVTRLEAQVKTAEVERREAEGAAIPFPEGKEKAAEQQALLATLQQALSAQGLDGDVTAVDCNEYPCIAHGKIAGIHDDELNAAVAAAKQKLGGLPYVSFNRFVDDKDPAKSQTTWSISLYPEGLPDDEQQNLNKRLRARKNAYVDAGQ